MPAEALFIKAESSQDPIWIRITDDGGGTTDRHAR
jgi:hypothetical protein